MSLPTSPSIDLAAFQKHIAGEYLATDKARGAPRTFLYFAEEVGELATALADVEKDPANTAARANLREEMADVIAWLCTLANIHDVDLASAVREKYLGEKRPSGVK